MRARITVVAAALLLGAAAAAGLVALRKAEQRARETVVARLARVGATAGEITVSPLGPVRIEKLAWSAPGGGRITADDARVWWRLDGDADPRAHVRRVALGGLRIERGPLAVEAPAIEADVIAWSDTQDGERIRLRQPAGGTLDARWRGGSERNVAIALSRFDVSSVRVRWGPEPVLSPGAWSGQLDWRQDRDHVATQGALSAEGVRISLPRALGLGNGTFGAPAAAQVAWDLTRDAARIELRRLTGNLGGIAVQADGRLEQPSGDRTFDLDVQTQTQLGPAFQTVGLHLPPPVEITPTDRLGTASVDVHVSGPAARPAELKIVPHLVYDSAPEVSQRLQFLKRPFRFRPADTEGVYLDVREDSPDFVALGRVPALFLRALLISEDAGFWGHPGVDVAEIPVAWAANVEKGTAARGASTITQQLVKNLFLSKDKSYGRKLEEAALALLVDAALPKTRILEIYVNVIEWGPGIYGLVPAARHYFGKRPDELSAKEIAFLVCLIPSPIRYHQAHVAGHVGPGMEQLMANLLAKLRSVDALDDEAYERALAETLRFAPEDHPADAALTGTD